MTRFVLRALLAVAAVVTVGLGSVDTALAQKRGGTLTIVRPTDPVSLDPNLETTAPGRGCTSTCSRGSSPSTTRCR